jgi:hypothetical protein
MKEAFSVPSAPPRNLEARPLGPGAVQTESAMDGDGKLLFHRVEDNRKRRGVTARHLQGPACRVTAFVMLDMRKLIRFHGCVCASSDGMRGGEGRKLANLGHAGLAPPEWVAPSSFVSNSGAKRAVFVIWNSSDRDVRKRDRYECFIEVGNFEFAGLMRRFENACCGGRGLPAGGEF